MQTPPGATDYSRLRRFCQINYHVISYLKKSLIALVLVFLNA